jgi:DNA-binding transcriptional LysR family regulator
MHVTSARATNLNLLVSLHALLETRSVTRAAQRVGVTQSSMSHALARLRDLFDDPLFTRGRAGLHPTPFCQGIAPRVFVAVGEVDALLAARHVFSKRESTRTFRIATSEPFALDAGRLLDALHAEAEGVRLVVSRLGEDAADRLSAGRLDAVIAGPHERPSGSVRYETLLRDRFVALVDRRSPLARTRLSVATYAAAKHVVVARDERPTFVDVALRAAGFGREIALFVPDFASIPAAIVGSERVATVPAHLAASMARTWSLRAITLALPLPPFEARLYWHARAEADPASVWFRATLTAEARGVPAVRGE